MTTSTIMEVDAATARQLIAGGATLVDVRGRDEHARSRIAGAVNVPLDELDRLPLPAGPLVFHCRSGMRTRANAGALAAAVAGGEAHLLTGGIDGWAAAGLPVEVDRGKPIEIMRQVQIAAGVLVLTGVILGLLVAPGFFGLSAFVGAGLTFAGLTGWCGMAKLLAVMPWNRAAASR
jgi:rhodanese-related sulfurtransferase